MNLPQYFYEYNPEEDVTRCPYGMSPVRKELNLYVKAAMRLYGLISISEMADLYNHYTDSEIDEAMIYQLLLPWVIKNEEYFFYENRLIVRRDFLTEDKEFLELEEIQNGKDRYIPETKEDFLQHSDIFYVDNPVFTDAQKFFEKYARDDYTVEDFSELLLELVEVETEPDVAVEIISYYSKITDKDFLKELDTVYKETYNHTRFMSLKGFTPAELYNSGEDKINVDRQVIKLDLVPDDAPAISHNIGRNDPCLCTSGKKYKACCLRNIRSSASKIKIDEAQHFYQLRNDLLTYVNKQTKYVTVAKFEKTLKRNVDINTIATVRQQLWENPGYILDFINENKSSLPQDDLEIYQSWYDNFIPGNFLVVRYEKGHTLLVDFSNQVYAVKGLTKAIGEIVGEAPVLVNTCLIPYKGQIIYDSFIVPKQINLSEETIELIQKALSHAIENDGIIYDLTNK